MNLEILYHKDNAAKKESCSISLDQLLQQIQEFENENKKNHKNK